MNSFIHSHRLGKVILLEHLMTKKAVMKCGIIGLGGIAIACLIDILVIASIQNNVNGVLCSQNQCVKNGLTVKTKFFKTAFDLMDGFTGKLDP
jgi:hypothetical protein